MWVEEPGSARNQIGLSLCEIRDSVRNEDAFGVANHTRYLIALASPHLPTDSRKGLRQRMPDPDQASENEIFEACMTIVEDLLEILASVGLYTWVAPEVGDASDLAL